MLPIASPCVKLCVLDDRSSLCRGCGRTPDEIAAWTVFTPDRRAMIMAALPDRLTRSRNDRRTGSPTTPDTSVAFGALA